MDVDGGGGMSSQNAVETWSGVSVSGASARAADRCPGGTYSEMWERRYAPDSIGRNEIGGEKTETDSWKGTRCK